MQASGNSLRLNTTGESNSFFGDGAGQHNTTGSFNSFFGAIAGGFGLVSGRANSFFGASSGTNNRTGSNNTIIGSTANVSAGDLTFATAIGSGAIVSTSNTIVLGRENGSDKVCVFGLGAAGATQLRRNASNEISTCSSSLRYKTSIAPFSFGLSFIHQLRPISFAWKDGGTADIGFGAEDVAHINPLFVTYNPKGEVEGVKYDRLSAAFVNAFKEQQTQLERQQKQLDELLVIKAENAELKAQLAQLKQLVCAAHPTASICRQP